MDEENGLNDIARRLKRVERKKQVSSSVSSPDGKEFWFDEDVQLASGTATTDVAETKLGLAELGVPGNAKKLILWAGTTDACDGTGLNYLYYHSGGKQLILCEQRGTSTSDTQNNMNPVVVPYYGGATYSIDLNGATSFPWRIAIRGYEI